MRCRNRQVAPSADICACFYDQSDWQTPSAAARIVRNDLSRTIRAAAITDHNLIRRPRLRSQRIQQPSNAFSLIVNRDNSRNMHIAIVHQKLVETKCPALLSALRQALPCKGVATVAPNCIRTGRRLLV
jgi:hypothetical protein